MWRARRKLELAVCRRFLTTKFCLSSSVARGSAPMAPALSRSNRTTTAKANKNMHARALRVSGLAPLSPPTATSALVQVPLQGHSAHVAGIRAAPQCAAVPVGGLPRRAAGQVQPVQLLGRPFRYLISVIAFPPLCNFRILTSVATLLLTSDPLSLESDLSTRSKTSKWRGLMSTSEWYGTGQYKG